MRFQLVSHAAMAAMLFVAQSAHAQDADDRDDDTPIIVTGAGLEGTLPQELERYGHDLVMVSEERIENSGAVDVATALRTVPGLYIQPGSGPFSYVDVSLQGSRTQDVLWTVDGSRINNRLYGSTSPNDTLPAAMVERIEILKGGESLFYGTQAAAGVINIVTRSFSDEFGGRVDGSIDSFGGTEIGGFVRGSAGRHRVVAWASHNQSDGYRPYSAFQPSATDRERGYELWSVGAKYQIDLGSDFLLNAQYQHTESKLDNISATRTRESRNDRNEEIASVRFDYVGNDAVQLFLKGYYHDWDTAYVQILNDVTTGAPIVVYPPGTYWGFEDYGINALAKLNLHRGLEYLVGYDYQKFNGRDDVLLIGDTNEQVHAGIFQVRTTDDLFSRGRLAAGLRYNDGNGARKAVWNVSGRFDVTDALYVEGNGGTSFLLPSASQLFQIDPCCEQGNPNLEPEESLNLNISAGGDFWNDRISLKATYFRRRIDNLISISFDDPAFPEGLYVNTEGRVKVEGGEAIFAANLMDGLNLDASYTYTRARNRTSDLQLNRIPKHLARGTLAYSPAEQPFGGNVTVNWVGDVWTTATGFGRLNYGNYAIVDAGIHVFTDRERRHRIGFNVENLFDKEYATRGFQSAARDDGSGRFLYYARGVPQSFRLSYSLGF